MTFRVSKNLQFIFIFVILFSNVLANGKRSIGILPFENVNGKAKYDWVGFGFEYILSNKLSNIAAFYVPEQQIIKRALRENNYGEKKINGEMIYRIGKETGISIAVTGAYSTNGKVIELHLSMINSFTGATILAKTYKQNFSEMFDISDDIIISLINLSAVNLSEKENNIVNRRITNSISAFENFCLGYLENENPNGRNEVTISLFRRALRDDPKFWEASYNLGIVFFNDKEYDKALQQFDNIIAALPNFEKPYYGRGLIYVNKKEYSKAKEDFLKVTEFNPNDYKPFYHLGKISVQLKQYNEANDYLKKAAEINPDYSNIYYEMGNIYFAQRKYRQAVPHYKKTVDLNPDNIDAHEKLGESYYRIQVYYNAYSEFKKVLDANPNEPVANFMLGITVYKQAVLNELIEAFLEMLEQNLGAAPENPNSNPTGNSSATKEKSELYLEMADAFYKAQKNRKNFLEATFNLALTYHEMGKLDSALIYYKKTLLLKSDLVRAHIKMAHLYEERNEKDLALAKYKEVINIDPAYFVAHPTLGPVHHYINIIDLYLEELNDRVQENPNDLQANEIIAKVYYAQGFYGKAANVYRKILTINPNNTEAKKMLAKLESR